MTGRLCSREPERRKKDGQITIGGQRPRSDLACGAGDRCGFALCVPGGWALASSPAAGGRQASWPVQARPGPPACSPACEAACFVYLGPLVHTGGLVSTSATRPGQRRAPCWLSNPGHAQRFCRMPSQDRQASGGAQGRDPDLLEPAQPAQSDSGAVAAAAAGWAVVTGSLGCRLQAAGAAVPAHGATCVPARAGPPHPRPARRDGRAHQGCQGADGGG